MAHENKYILNKWGFGSHEAITDWTDPNTKVLEVGCASGYLMDHIAKTKGCTVLGIEPDPVFARLAREAGLSVIKADAATAMETLSDHFDHIVFADVLEHIAVPLPVLRSARELLSPGGSVLVSLPNIAFIKARARVLVGNWTYEESGIFDETHLRFFTVASAREFIRDAGFKIRREIFVGPLTHRNVRHGAEMTRLRPGLLASQMVFQADPIS